MVLGGPDAWSNAQAAKHASRWASAPGDCRAGAADDSFAQHGDAPSSQRWARCRPLKQTSGAHGTARHPRPARIAPSSSSPRTVRVSRDHGDLRCVRGSTTAHGPYPFQSLCSPGRRLVARAPRPCGWPAGLRHEQRLRRVSRQDVHQFSSTAGALDAAVREARGFRGEFPRRPIWVELAGLAPAALLLVLEKLRRTGRSWRTERQNVALALLYAFGTVYFFSAVEGTVWFVAMVVGAAEGALYALWALDAERPALAGTMLACAWLTRTPVFLTIPLFALEALRVSVKGELAMSGSLVNRIRALPSGVDFRALARRYALFAADRALASESPPG